MTVWGDNYPNFESVFSFGMFRWLETTVGVLIYTIVDLVIWPRHAGDQLGALGQSYISSVRQLVTSYRERVQPGEPADNTSARQASVSGTVSKLAITLRSAYVDTPEVKSQKTVWELWMENAGVLASTLSQLGESIATINALECRRLVPQPEAELGRLDSRLERIEVLWQRTHQPNSDNGALVEPNTFELDDSEFAELHDPERAIVSRYLRQLRSCEQASCNLLRATRVLVGLDSSESLISSLRQGQQERPSTSGSTRAIRALFPPLVFIAACFFWIFWNPPTGAKVPMLAGILSLVVLRTSVNPAAALVALFGSASLVVAPIYWLVMPRLSSAPELLTLIFLYAFLFRYLGGRWPVLKSCPIILFAVMTGISNQQQYSFQAPVDGALMVLLAGAIVTVVYYLCVPLVPSPSTRA